MICLCIFAPIGGYSSAYALETDTSTIETALMRNLAQFLNQNSSFDYNRMAGTVGEYNSALSLSRYLSNYNLQAKTNKQDSSIVQGQDGMQEFAYDDDIFYEKRISHNIIYTIKGASSDKRIVISTNYDNYPYGYDNLDEYDEVTQDTILYCSQGINASASSVAVLLTLAQLLPQNYFNFDIDIIFFGAGYQHNAGAKYYNQTMSQSDRDRTMLMMDISRIGLGESLYYYSGEFSNKNSFYGEILGFKRFKNSFHGASTSEDNLLGYTSAGYSGSIQAFEGSGLNVLHLFAGAYENGLFGGYCEYSDKGNLENSVNDTLSYINANRGADLKSNMTQTVSAVQKMLNNSKCTQTLSKGESIWQYKLLKSNIMIILVVVLFILIIISLIIHYHLENNAYKYASDNKIDGVMIQIDNKEDGTPDSKNEQGK